MESKWRVLLLTALAPVAWGSGYHVTATYLPADRPLFGATVRALPFGLLLLAARPALPQGSWRWRAPLLGTLNIGAFFVLVFVAAQRLPGGLAATLTATAPLAIMLLAWPLAGERPAALSIAGGLLGAGGVALLVLDGGVVVDPVGVAASFGAVLMSSLGFVLVKRWRPPVDLLTLTAWQLVAGGAVLLPVALLVEGRPPAVDGPAVAGFLWIGGVGAVVAYAVWFRGLRDLPAAAVGLVGLLNPLTGTLIGVLVAGELFGPAQAAGTALVLLGVVVGQPAVASAVRSRVTSRANSRARRRTGARALGAGRDDRVDEPARQGSERLPAA